MKLKASVYVVMAGFFFCFLCQSSEGQESPNGEPSAVEQKRELDVSFIPSDFCAAIVVHPARMAESGVVSKLPIDGLFQKFIGLTGFDIRDVEQLVAFVDPMPGGNVGAFPAAVIRFSNDVDVLQTLSPRLDDLQEQAFAERIYWTSKKAGMAGTLLGIHAIDKRTVVVAPEATLQQMLTVGKVESPLVNRLKKIDLNNDAVLVMAFEPVRAIFKMIASVEDIDRIPPPIQPLLSLPQDAKSLTIELSLSGDSLLTLAFEPNVDVDSEARVTIVAKHVHDLLKDLQENTAQQLQEQLPPVAKLVQQLVDGINVDKENGQVVMRIKRPEDLLETIEKIAPMVQAQMPGEASPQPSR